MPSLHVAIEIDVHARASKAVDRIIVDLGSFGSIHVEPDKAHALIDELQAALRDLAAHPQETR
ncbi:MULTISPECIES: hypothetical protein [Rhodococcus]|uniref:hypothetical protein n=1 Tax=Rhodococcus TaxID=1827 RepID=UPI001C2FB9CE|nr:hypothetical protein [Rhodococcus pyridinivorans]MCD2117095.1 hypothetical protein [Rhodococcus pyridinivorans]MCZ4626063.1 hypothetical protein [Rhodococcus pyridinivorans]MCZ4647171.1 hypothetical protein [Rhodococcus pyridinivorans]MDJ0483576.1 hypothetical protein [Rhodococcus pyridinivorans]MDV7253122.1 hypothetical protein [Rhodococcus pyridinivorans]